MHRRINLVPQNSRVQFLHRQQILQRNYFGLLPPALLPAWNEAILQGARGKLYPWCLEKAWILKASPWDPETQRWQYRRYLSFLVCPIRDRTFIEFVRSQWWYWDRTIHGFVNCNGTIPQGKALKDDIETRGVGGQDTQNIITSLLLQLISPANYLKFILFTQHPFSRVFPHNFSITLLLPFPHYCS